MKPGRNALCSCGSGKKFKNCCEGKIPSDPIPPSAEVMPLVALYNSRHYAELEERARHMTERYPNFGFGWKLLAGALHMQRKNALAALQMATELMPGEAGMFCNLGNALKSFGRLDDAVNSYRRALEIDPGYAEAHSNLGIVLYELGQCDDAVSSFQKARELKPDSALSHYNLGKILSELGRLDEAIACYRKAVEIQPDYAQAHYNLGNAMKILGQLDDAAANYRRALEFDPRFTEAYINLGVILQEQERYSGAEICYQRALNIKPGMAEAYANLGHVQRHLGRFNEALKNYLRALEINPEYGAALLGAGLQYLEEGDASRAERLFNQAIEFEPANVEARYLISLARRVESGDANFAKLREMEASVSGGKSDMPVRERIYLNFALGKSFDDTRDYDQAFQHYLKGCRLKRDTIAYDPEQAEKYLLDIAGTFDTALIAHLRGSGDPSRVPIFVLGMPRSGTTLVEQIIASHPEVHGAGELPDLLAIIRRAASRTGKAFPENMHLADRHEITGWGKDYVESVLKRSSNAIHVVDKMPENFLAIGLIHLMLPNATVIHVNRNPVDTCLSCYTKLFNSGIDYSYDLAELGKYYVGYRRLMEHWRSVLPEGAFLDVQYEDIVADLETQARRMIDFCGLTWDEACVEFHKSQRSVRTASLAQVRQPIYSSSVNRWQRYEKYIGPLLDALGDLALADKLD